MLTENLKDRSEPRYTSDGSSISIRNLFKTYYDRVSGVTQVLHDISLRVDHGKVVGLFGPSSCGKSTLLRIIVGVLPFDSGEVLIDGRPVSEQRGKVAYVPQTGNLLEWNTLFDNA